ncbi:MAG: quinol:cytochrome C oxidoreductase [Kofleriaceae bacterium]
MSLTRTLHPDEKFKAGKLGSSMVKAGLGLAVIMMIVSLVLGYMHDDGFKRFLYAYVVGWAFIVSIAIGMLWLVLLHHLTRSRWSTVVRRIAEAITSAFTVIYIAGLGFVLPVLFGNKTLYYWTTADAHNATLNPTLAHKLGWLSPGSWSIRYCIFGAIYIGISWYFAKKSREQDESGDPKISDTLRRAAGPAMILFALTTCLMSMDLLMSLAPKWYSTIYGVDFWGSACVGGFATLGLIVLWVQRNGRLTHSITEEHYHDIGKWMFTFTFFWAYTAFSQFMLQWYGNMPEETVWYKYRMFGGWQWVSIAILVGYWAFPFIFLMSRWTKRIVPTLVFFSVWQLVFHWLDMYWNAMPSYDWTTVTHGGATVNQGPLMNQIALHHVGFTPLDITVWLALIGVLLVGIGRNLTGNLIPIKDPTLGLSLAHEQL